LVFYRSSGDSGLEVLKSRFLLPFRGIATWSDSAFHLSSAPLRGNRIFVFLESSLSLRETGFC